VSDIGFIPEGVKVDKRNPSEGKMSHFVSISEDGLVNIWDTRPVDKDSIRNNPEFIWRPFISVPLIRQDGSGELGLSRILFQSK
jgi:hypothetical protein